MAQDIPPEGPETPEALLERTTNAIRATNWADSNLLDILVQKILVLTPSGDAVAEAVEAIETLAEERAAEIGDGGSDQD